MAKFIIEGERFFEPYRSQHVSLARAIKAVLKAIDRNTSAPKWIKHKGVILWDRSVHWTKDLERLARRNHIKL